MTASGVVNRRFCEIHELTAAAGRPSGTTPRRDHGGQCCRREPSGMGGRCDPSADAAPSSRAHPRRRADAGAEPWAGGRGGRHTQLADGGFVATHEEHHRAVPRRDADPVHGPPRRADPAAQPRAVPGAHGGRPWCWPAAARVLRCLCLDLDQFKAVNDTLGPPGRATACCMSVRRAAHCLRPHHRHGRPASAVTNSAFILAGMSVAEEAAALARRIIPALSAPL